MLAAIGDVHGCKEELIELLKLIVANKDLNTIVMLGDYIDRGTDSKGVLDLLMSWPHPHIELICLCGNHETMMLHSVLYNNKAADNIWVNNGALQTITSFKDNNEIKKYCKWIEKNVLLSYRIKNLFFVHAGIDPKIKLDEQLEETLLWTRNKEFFDATEYPENVTVIHGHTPLKEPKQHNCRIAIDTACVYGNKLTAALFKDNGDFIKFESVNKITVK